MHAEYSIVDEGSNRQAVKAVNEEFPQFNIISSFAYVSVEVH